MKRSLLSLIIPALLVASTTNAAEIYNKDANKIDLSGQVHGLHYFSKDEGNDGDKSFARLGVKGETQINPELTGYGRWEYQFDAHHVEGAQEGSTRYGFAGLSYANIGSLDYGRNDGAVYDITSWTDELPEFGGDTYETDNFKQARANSLLTYRNKNFFGLVNGLNFTLQYQAKNTGTLNAMKQNGDGFGASVFYDMPVGISVGAALSTSRRTDGQNALDFGSGDKAETYTIGVKYDGNNIDDTEKVNNIYVAAHYTQTYNATVIGDIDDGFGFANQANNLEIVAKYTFDFGLTPSIAYLQSRGKDLVSKSAKVNYGEQDLLKYVDIGLNHDFNANMTVYVDYKINLLKKNDFTEATGISTDNIVGLGVVYQF